MARKLGCCRRIVGGAFVNDIFNHEYCGNRDEEVAHPESNGRCACGVTILRDEAEADKDSKDQRTNVNH